MKPSVLFSYYCKCCECNVPPQLDPFSIVGPLCLHYWFNFDSIDVVQTPPLTIAHPQFLYLYLGMHCVVHLIFSLENAVASSP